MQARMKNPVYILPEAMKGITTLIKSLNDDDLSQELQELVALRTSQINGCSVCVYGHLAKARKAGVTDERLFAVAAWREAPFFTDAERVALALAESVTRLADRSGDAVPDELWNEAVDHFDEKQLSAILFTIGLTNMFNRINAVIKEPAGATWD